MSTALLLVFNFLNLIAFFIFYYSSCVILIFLFFSIIDPLFFNITNLVLHSNVCQFFQ